MFERKVHWITSVSAPALALALGLPSVAALAQQDATSSATNSTTNLGTLVVAPQKAPNQSSAPKPDLRVQRQSLNLNLGVSPTPPPNGRVKQPPQPQQHQAVQRTPPSPLHIVQPQYPVAAYNGHLKGTVTVGFTIDASGSTSHIHIIGSQPPGVFDDAARAAVKQWLFQPATVNGQPVAENVSQTLVFRPPAHSQQSPAHPASVRHSGGPPSDSVPGNIHPVRISPPRYPPAAYNNNRGGRVTVSFVVDPNGRTSHIRVVYSKPRHIFDNAAMNAVRRWRFKPVSKPTTVVQTIRFTPPN